MKKTLSFCSNQAIDWLVDQAKKTMLPRLISVAGGTCSGKTTFAEVVLRHLNSVGFTATIIHLDEYFLDVDDHTFPKHNLEEIFDVPEAYHRKEFVADVFNLSKGLTTRIPIYDLATNKRHPEKIDISPADFIIADGLFTGTFLSALQIKTIHVYMDTPVDVCLQRRIARDTKKYHVPSERVIENWRRKILPFWQHHQQNEKNLAHIIVSETTERN